MANEMPIHLSATKYSSKIEWHKKNPNSKNKSYSSIVCLKCDTFFDDIKHQFYVVGNSLVLCVKCYEAGCSKFFENTDENNAIIEDDKSETTQLEELQSIIEDSNENNATIEDPNKDVLNYFNQINDEYELNNVFLYPNKDVLNNQNKDEEKLNAFTSTLMTKISNSNDLKSNDLSTLINIGIKQTDQLFKSIMSVKCIYLIYI